jgi:GNAT superfamily N-acetyltransferase
MVRLGGVTCGHYEHTGMTPEFKLEHISDVVEELKPLAVDHHAEVNFFSDTALDIDWDRYGRSQKMYCFITCRVDGELIGWLGFWVHPHIRHKSYLVAIEDWYYIKPEYRRRGWGKKMFESAEGALKAGGVKRIMVSCKTYQDYTPLLEGLGYVNYEKNFTKI